MSNSSLVHVTVTDDAVNANTITSNDIDSILDEIDQVEHRTTSAQDALCEIYSRAQAKWLKGTIIKQFAFEKEQWLFVEYSNNTFQELKLDSKYVRLQTKLIPPPPTNNPINVVKPNKSTNTDRKSKKTTPNKTTLKPTVATDNSAGKCKHMGCHCQQFKPPTSKWAKNKFKCHRCDHSKREHTAIVAHATNKGSFREEEKKDESKITKNILATTKSITPATAEQTFLQKQVDEMDDKFKHLIYGFSRAVSDTHSYVPDLVIFIILSYFYSFDIEEFDHHLCAKNIKISNFNKTITRLSDNGYYESCYGIKIMPSTVYKTYIWTFKNIGRLKNKNLKIGICNAIYTETSVHKNFTLDSKHEFYVFKPFLGKWEIWNQRPKFGFPKSVMKGDKIVIKLKITKYMAFIMCKVNKSKEYRGCNVVQRQDLYYRMAVTFSDAKSCIELVDFKVKTE